MFFNASRPQHATLLAAVVVVASATALSLGHYEDDQASYKTGLSLLQVHAGSHKLEGVGKHQRAALGDDDSARTMKAMFPYYHTSAEIRKKAELLSRDCGHAMKMETISEGGVDIDVVHVRAPKSTPVNKVFILFGEHSRELISPESAIRLLEVICGKVGVDRDTLSVGNILLESEFQLVLNGNPKSRNRVEDGEYCLRANPNGVDLNRNWDEKWTEKDAMGSQTNPGPRPFSEPETKIFKSLVEKYEPTTFLTVHSGTRGMYMPYAYDMDHEAQFNAPLMLSVLKDLDKNHCQCPYGAAGKEVGYPCPGTCLDWVYNKLKTPYVYAFEIYTSADRDADLKQRWQEKSKEGLNLLQNGGHLGHQHFGELFSNHTSDFVQRQQHIEAAKGDECFSMFNPDTEIVYNKTVQNWAEAYLEMAAMVAKELKEKKSEDY
jgi:hypothetical protein